MSVNNRDTLLLIEDESGIRSFMETILSTNGYRVVTADSCTLGETLFASYRPDLVILDLGLPDRDGLEFITAARKHTVTPILVLSARTDEADKVAALDRGANDYVTKPFGTAELLARVRAQLRNSRYRDADGQPEDRFTLRDMTIDYGSRRVTIGDREIKLTQTEYHILTYLARHPGKVLTYANIIRAVWGDTDSGSVKKSQVNMANIRKKCGGRPGEKGYIDNELGVGYRMPEE